MLLRQKRSITGEKMMRGIGFADSPHALFPALQSAVAYQPEMLQPRPDTAGRALQLDGDVDDGHVRAIQLGKARVLL